MKKIENEKQRMIIIIVIIAVFLGILALFGGNSTTENEEIDSTPKPTATATAKPTPTPIETLAPQPTIEPTAETEPAGNAVLNPNMIFTGTVRSGTGSAIGNYGYITVDKEAFLNIDISEYKNFLEKYISGKHYNWFVIKFNDKTGIVFPNCFTGVSDYSRLDSTDSAIESINSVITSELSSIGQLIK